MNQDQSHDWKMDDKAETGRKSSRVLPVIAIVLVLVLAVFGLSVLQNDQDTPNEGQLSQQEPAGEPGDNANASTDGEAGSSAANNGLQAVSNPAANNGLYGLETPGAANIVAEYQGVQLSNQLFQYYYWDMFFSFYSSYGDYLAYYLSMSTPFDQQSYSETQTWNDYFTEMAATNWLQTELICAAAEKDGYQLTGEDANYVEETMASLEEYAGENGYGTPDGYLHSIFDPSSDAASYGEYLGRSALASSYATSRYQQFYDEVYDPAAEMDYCINVRHILIMPEEGSDIPDADAAQKRAEELYQEFLADPSEEKFAEMAGTYSGDPGSVSNGGLYTDVQPGQMVTEFNDWCFAEERQPGDHGIVQTSYGSHIMYFVGESETAYNDPNQTAAQEKYTQWLDGLLANAAPEIHSDAIVFTQRVELASK